MLAGARGLHSSVERKDISLECNGIDDPDDVGDLLRTVLDVTHGGHHPLHHFPPLAGDGVGVERKIVGFPCVVGIPAHVGIEFRHAGGGFFQTACFGFGALGQVHIAGCNFPGGGIDCVRRSLEMTDNFLQAQDGGVDGFRQLAEQAGILAADALGQVAGRDGLGNPDYVRKAGLGHIRPPV